MQHSINYNYDQKIYFVGTESLDDKASQISLNSSLRFRIVSFSS